MPNISVSLSGQNPNDPITEINCGTSSPRFGGDVNISLFPELTGFYCTGFDIKSINISGNKKLERLEIFDNKITELPSSLASNQYLTHFNCSKNEINGSIPNIGTNQFLKYFNCSGNNFTGFNGTSINHALKEFYANNNKLYSSAVDNILNAINLNGSTDGTLNLSQGNDPPSITNIKVKQVMGSSFVRLADSNIVTVTLVNHGYFTNDIVTIKGLGQPTFNGTFKITRLSSSQFTYISSATTPQIGIGTATITSSSGLNDGFKKYQNLTLPVSQGGKGWDVEIADYFIKQLGDTINEDLYKGSFGFSIDINDAGNRVIVGIPSALSYQGAVQIFEWDGENWNIIFNFTMPTTPSPYQAGAGASVSINAVGDVIAIGAPSFRVGSTPRGKVFIYKESLGVWNLKTSKEGSFDFGDFGYCVSLNSAGDRIAIGEPGFSNNQGSTSVYTISNTQGLLQIASDIEGDYDNEKSGFSVSLNQDGDAVLIGSPFYKKYLPPFYDVYQEGRAKLFKLELNEGTQYWSLEKEFQGDAERSFGYSVSLKTTYKPNFAPEEARSDIVVIGAPTSNSNRGFVVRYESAIIQSAPNQYYTSWYGKVSIPAILEDGYLGDSVDLNNSGDRLIIGAPFSFVDDRGQFRVFKEDIAFDSNGVGYIYWNQVGIGAEGVDPFDIFGRSVAMNGAGNIIAVAGDGFVKVYELLD